jgi:predicted Zn-dependent peptidase
MGVFLFMRTGFSQDPKRKEGLAHFVEHLSMTGGSLGRKKGWTIQEWFRKRPDGCNAMTRGAWTQYFSLGKRADILEDLHFFAQIARGKVLFSQEAMVRERGRMLQEIHNMTQRMPGGVLMWKIRSLLDAKGRSGIGRMEDVRRLELKDCEDFRDRFYRPNHSLFVLVGDVKLEEDKVLLNRLLGNGSTRGTSTNTGRGSQPIPVDRSPRPSSFVGTHAGVGAPFLSLAFSAPDPKSPRAPVFTLAAFYLMRKALASFRPRGRELQAFFQPAQYPVLEDPFLFFLNRRAKDGENLKELRQEVRSWLSARKKDRIKKDTLEFLQRGLGMLFWPHPLSKRKKRFLMKNTRALYSLGLSTGALRVNGFPPDFFDRLQRVSPEDLKVSLARDFSYERGFQAALLPRKPGK